MKLSKLTWAAGFIVLIFLALAIFAPWLSKYGPETIDIFSTRFLAAPNADHIMGTDYVGRDVWTRLTHGIRNSIFFSLVVVTISLFFGVIIGGIMGFFGGRVDMILSRGIEVIGNFPIFLLQLTLLAFFEQSYGILLFVMLISGWIPYCRFARAEFFRLRNQEFVLAARALGASRRRIFFRHLLPNSLSPTLIYAPFDLSSTIIVLGALSFLGFGEPINVASLGELLQQAKDHFREAWWLAVFPGGALFLLTLSLALFGSGLRDALDPRASLD